MPQQRPHPESGDTPRRLIDLLRATVAHSRIPQLVHTAEGRVLALSQALVDLTGYSLSEIPSGLEFLVKCCGMDREQAEKKVANYAKMFNGPPPYPHEEAVVFARDGTRRAWQFHVATVLEDEDGTRYVVTSAVDVTERKRAERELAMKHEFIERIFSTHPNSLYVFDLIKQAPVFQNQHLAKTLGYDREEVRKFGAELVRRLMHPQDQAAFMDHKAKLSQAADDTILTFEYRMQHCNGSWRWFVSHDTVFSRTESGDVEMVLGTATEITELKRAQDDRLAMSLHMQELQKMESLAMLAGGIAHDFNNLLVGIMGSADLAMTQLPKQHAAVHDLERIQQTAVECAELCKQLLAYAGKGKFLVEPFHLPHVIEQIGHLLQISTSKNVSLNYQFADNVPAVEGDVRQMRQVIMNLIKNASDSIGDKSGVITVRVGAIAADRAYLEAAVIGSELKEGPYVSFEVSDTGCGIPKSELGRIFDPFFTSKREGRGLGLAAVRGIIKGHGGAIRVYSEEGKGTCFKVLLPASNAKVGVISNPNAARALRPSGGTVLVVDDEETVRAVASRSLSTLGFSVLQATDGREAVAIFREYHAEIRLVLLDMMMPVMGGQETLLQLRQLEPNVNVILMSGYNEQDATNAFAGRGLAGFIQKPFRHGDLVDVLNAALTESPA